MPTEVNGAAREPASPGALAPLESLDALRDVGRFGGKAARLGELSRAGFPVPLGLAIPVSTVEVACTDGAGEAMATLVREVIATLGEGPVAVRSSGVVEDLAMASFAGQYETVLKVRGHEAIAEAIQRCRASAERQHVAAYSNNHVAEVETAIPAVRGMAVLIQQMVAADAAGVAFTADPVTGRLTR